MVDLHRHDDFSLFDGLGKPLELARLAKDYGYTALGTANHGTASGLVEHFLACKEAGIKPILGVEAYFMPEFDRGRVDGKSKRYHLCLFCKNIEGYKNLNRMLSYANVRNFFYKPIITFELLEKYHEGLICSSACISGYPSKNIEEGNAGRARKALKKFKGIFGEDFYIEIQPYKLRENKLQERVNEELFHLAGKLDIKCILTSDSHFGKKGDIDTYVKMHEMKGRVKENILGTYKERYMPRPGELERRFIDMHGEHPGNKKKVRRMVSAMEELVEKVEDDFLSGLPLTLPKFQDGEDANERLKKEIKEGLKKRGKYTREYMERCSQEYKVISMHGFSEYFLIVQDYVKWAKERGIAVGPGRGSVCNSLVAYSIGITDVDSLKFNLDFRRFLREDKKKLPDCDIDFETDRRAEVLEYLIKKYKGKAVQICSFGLYKVDNLLNDLFKVCGVEEGETKKAIKDYIKSSLDHETETLDYSGLEGENRCKEYNVKYENIIKHFSKMYMKVRYIGTHAAGVAIVAGNILDYTSIEKHGEKYSSAYDLNNLEKINVVKFDMLGLKTMTVIQELQEMTGEKFNDRWLEDKKVLKQFGKGDTEGIFQFEKRTAQNILVDIEADCIEDITAANALNRPGPLGLKMPEHYAFNKMNASDVEKDIFFNLTSDTYGTVVYQEQITSICTEIGGTDWAEADKVLKFMKNKAGNEREQEDREREVEKIKKLFISGAMRNGVSRRQAENIFSKMLVYSFNKGHALGYAIIAATLMWYKVHYPLEFWCVTMRHASNDDVAYRYKKGAIDGDIVVLPPHINGVAYTSIVEVEGDECIQEGYCTIKGVGEVAAKAIFEEMKKNGPYKDMDDIEDRNPKRVANARVLKALKENYALVFDMKKYYSNAVKYNTAILVRGSK